MRQHLAPVTLVAVIFVGIVLVGPARPGAVAQDATPGAVPELVGHPVVGSWRADTVPQNPDNPSALLTFHADGTFFQEEAGDIGIGAWEAAAARSARLIILFVFDDAQGAENSVTARAAVEVAEDGQTFTAQYTLEFTGADGVPNGEYGPGTIIGTRITVEPMGTPVGPFAAPQGTPVVTGGTPVANDGGTPTP